LYGMSKKKKGLPLVPLLPCQYAIGVMLEC
jgi:hypothetical protein